MRIDVLAITVAAILGAIVTFIALLILSFPLAVLIAIYMVLAG